MRSQTVKFAKNRLAKFDAVRIYSYEYASHRTVRRAGVVRVCYKEN